MNNSELDYEKRRVANWGLAMIEEARIGLLNQKQMEYLKKANII